MFNQSALNRQETYINGFKFEGEFKKGKKEGKGVCTWENGDKFKG